MPLLFHCYFLLENSTIIFCMNLITFNPSMFYFFRVSLAEISFDKSFREEFEKYENNRLSA